VATSIYEALLGIKPPRPSAFVSFHHGGDFDYYEAFARMIDDTFELVRDRSVRNAIDSDNADYVIRRIRENYITGTSCTIVLCGEQTHARKFVDWEIKATLDKRHALVGVLLPTVQAIGPWGLTRVPDRLQDNIDTRYASVVVWDEVLRTPAVLVSAINRSKTASTLLINNDRPLMPRSRPA